MSKARKEVVVLFPDELGEVLKDTIKKLDYDEDDSVADLISVLQAEEGETDDE